VSAPALEHHLAAKLEDALQLGPNEEAFRDRLEDPPRRLVADVIGHDRPAIERLEAMLVSPDA